LSYQRIIRIAVHPAIQSRGLGQKLLSNIELHVSKSQCDVIGASFAASTELLSFWRQSGFIPVRLGLQQDDVSGSHAVMMLKACSDKGQEVAGQAQKRLTEQWPYLLATHLKQVDADLLIAVSQLIPANQTELPDLAKQEINAFSFEQRGFEVSQYSLSLWLQEVIKQADFLQLDPEHQVLCIKAVLQNYQWTELCQQLPYTGKKQAVLVLRKAIETLLGSNKLHDGK